ncbi:MAG: hypothetical protein HMLIMOIP_002683 [Candidatus Nitrosomirales archaeon]
MQGITKASSQNSLQAILAIGLALVLVSSSISTIASIQLPNAFAEKGSDHPEKGQSNHGKDKSNHKSNQTTTSSSNSTESDVEESNKGKGRENHSHQSIKHSWEDQLNQTADEIHEKHLKMEAGFYGPYTSDLTYTLNVNGTADAIGNSSYAGEAELSLDMSVWKSTPGLVKMDVVGGTVMVDGESMEVHSGHAYYWINKDRMLIVAFVTEGGYNENEENANGGNETSTDNTGNQTSSSNQTSIDNTTNQTSTTTDDAVESEGQGLSEHQVRILKLWITIPEGDELPTDEVADPIQVDVMSRQSKVASMWFLEMHGEVTLAT